jgi:hypothetical protein
VEVFFQSLIVRDKGFGVKDFSKFSQIVSEFWNC